MTGPLEQEPIRLPDDAAEAWARDRRVVVRGLVRPALAAAWEQGTRRALMRDTHVGNEPHVTWKEQAFVVGAAFPCSGLARDPGFLSSVSAATGIAEFDDEETMIWINRYAPGDRVPTHCDAVGDCQFLVCLEAPPRDSGGELVVEGEPVPLACGDAVLWEARTQPHSMTTITSDAVGPSGFSRVVFVIRLFAAGGAAETSVD